MIQRGSETKGALESPDKTASSPPSVSLPKGGGAIRGIGEKFAANPVTGTGSMSVPIYTSPGRSGFGPQLSLSYDSGAGNGPFGFGWSLSLPSITRKTDKGLPKYQNAVESDVFILSGAEDLVPVPIEIGGQQHDAFPRTVNGVDYLIQRYRPRIEGLFARIERWTIVQSGETHWRSISKDNITTFYGRTSKSQIVDPDDSLRVFSWLICESYDDKGKVIVYEYEEENSDGVDLSQTHEQNRSEETRSTNRYLKHIKYGNQAPYYPSFDENSPPIPLPSEWLFEVVFDYGEHDPVAPKPNDAGEWLCRHDPFSSYRAGFEVRTYRLCQRVLMFHHFPGEEGVGQNCLVRSTDFVYRNIRNNPDDLEKGHPVASFIASITQSGYKRQANGGYLKKSLPPLEFEYSRVPSPEQLSQQPIQIVDAESLENLPYGLDGALYQWVDLDGEGLSGILTEQAGSWFYKRNLSPANIKRENGKETVLARFAPVELVEQKPSLANVSGGQQQFLDLAGDGQIDLVQFAQPLSGYYERTQDESWSRFVPFESMPNLAWGDPNLKFVDLTGDGHADILVTEDQVFTWYLSLAEAGFGPAERVYQALDEGTGPRLVFADGTQSIYLADLSGDGLTDLARIRNGEICYWPNLGYGRFGAKVTMDDAPWFDYPDQFNQQRVRLADIDGSGTTDIIYLGRDGVDLYFNQAGNSWSKVQTLTHFPRTDNLSSVMAVDLLGNGTACLVWSSPLPGDVRQPMRYLDLMGGQKPHLLVKVVNNLGAETRVRYAPSTKFYLADKEAGKPWITKLPFPVHVVERVETYDRISRNGFVTRYAYHHGYFDGVEREFRGFGMVEQWDTEQYATLEASGMLADAENLDKASHVPPVLTKTWFHTGIYLGRDHVSNFFAGLLDEHDRGEYYREPAWRDDDAEARKRLLPDTVMPPGLTLEEEREACRALKGVMLRQEVYALDGTDKEKHPYTVTEQNFAIRCLQPKAGNRHAVFFTRPREAISYHYERNPADPRISHALTLEVDPYGNVLKEVAIGYGRRTASTDPVLTANDKAKQTRLLITYTENSPTNAIDDVIQYPDDYRTPLPAETRTYELTDFEPENNGARFSFDEWTRDSFALLASAVGIPYEQAADDDSQQKRLIEHIRTLYRKDDLTAFSPLGEVEPLALPGESYKLAFTPGLLTQVFQRDGQPLLSNPADVLAVDVPGNVAADRGGYVDLDNDDHWWIPAGRIFLSPNSAHTAAQELTYAQSHFFLPHRYRDPFHTNAVSTERFVTYDTYDLLMVETRDALGNRVTVGECLPNGNLNPAKPGNDYRVLQPWRVMDPNRNRSAVAFDTLGMVVGTAVMGKPEENLGDSLDGFQADLTETAILDHLANPLADPHAILGRATTRLVYDLFAYQRTKDQPDPQPAVVYTLARETHDADLEPGQQTKVQHSFSYSDGFGREIQKKIQAEPEKIDGVTGPPRWVGSGWTIFNNKGKPVRQYEPFFSATHRFEFGVQVGVSPILFYDPVGRVVATLHPNHTYEKVVFDPWRQVTFDVNDTVTLTPSVDDDVKGFFLKPGGTPRIPSDEYLPTWYELRTAPLHAVEFAARYPDATDRSNETGAAAKAAAHADTPTTAHFDTLGRPFLTIAHNKVVCPNHALDGTEDKFHTRVELDIEGNQREVRDVVKEFRDEHDNVVIDELGRIVMRYAYDMLGNRIHQFSMEAGARWMLNDVAGKPIRAWDSRGHSFRNAYDPLRRLLRSFVTGADHANPNQELLIERLVYGEQHPQDELRNLRGQLYLHLDQAGAVTTKAHDFKDNLLRASRRLAKEYKRAVDWDVVDAILPTTATVKLNATVLDIVLASQLEADTYTSRTTYDALNRPLTLRTPDNSVIRPGYNEANLLERMDVMLRGAIANGQPVWTPFVTNIDYDAKGQRQRIDYGNGVSTFYEYDPLTFRLVHLLTRRNAVVFPDDCPQPPPADWPGCQVQNLHYTYDPVGNITHIRDDAQQIIYFRNQRVEPSAEYTYDAIYRLIKATGREHLGQIGGAPIPHSHDDAPRVGIDWSANDGNAMGTYTERYVYDAVGNFLEMQHRGSDPVHPGWTRRYAYEETSLIEDGTGGTPLKTSNRLSRTTVGNNNPPPERYVHDAHGNIIRMPHLGGVHPVPNMHWDYKDQLQQVDLGGGTAYYVYDAAGQRVRKVIERQNNTKQKERIYLGGFEIYREYNGATEALNLERETLHVMDDKQRIALVETQTTENGNLVDAPVPLQRYQLGNHLGSASVELDKDGAMISYEEYHPYGTTAFQVGRSAAEVSLKRYRYTGKERDEESGLYYYGARYYAPWLGRWTSFDPLFMRDSLNLYEYALNNPIVLSDPDGESVIGKASWEAIEWALRKLAPKAARRTPRGTKRISQRECYRIAKKLGLDPKDLPPGGKISKKRLLKELAEKEGVEKIVKEKEFHEALEAVGKEITQLAPEAQGLGSALGVVTSLVIAQKRLKTINRLLGGSTALLIALDPEIAEAREGITNIRVDKMGVHLEREIEVTSAWGWLSDLLDVSRTYTEQLTITPEGEILPWHKGDYRPTPSGRIEIPDLPGIGEQTQGYGPPDAVNKPSEATSREGIPPNEPTEPSKQHGTLTIGIPGFEPQKFPFDFFPEP